MHSYQLSQVSHVYLSIPVSDFAWLDYCHIVYLGLKFSSFTSTLFQVFCTWSHSKCRQSFPAQHLQVTQTAAMPRAIPLPSLSDWRHRSRALADVTRSSSALVTSWILNCVVTLGEQMLFVAEVSGSVDQVSRSWVTLATAWRLVALTQLDTYITQPQDLTGLLLLFADITILIKQHQCSRSY